MAELGAHGAELSKTLSEAERDRRVAVVNCARVSVGLEELSLSAADETRAQRFIDERISLTSLWGRVAPWSTHKLSLDEEIEVMES